MVIEQNYVSNGMVSIGPINTQFTNQICIPHENNEVRMSKEKGKCNYLSIIYLILESIAVVDTFVLPVFILLELLTEQFKQYKEFFMTSKIESCVVKLFGQLKKTQALVYAKFWVNIR